MLLSHANYIFLELRELIDKMPRMLNVYPRGPFRTDRPHIQFKLLIKTNIDGFSGTVLLIHPESIAAKSSHYDEIIEDDCPESFRQVHVILNLERREFNIGVVYKFNTVLEQIFNDTGLADNQFLPPVAEWERWHDQGDMAFFFRSKKVDMVKPARDLLLKLWQPPKLQKVRHA